MLCGCLYFNCHGDGVHVNKNLLNRDEMLNMNHYDKVSKICNDCDFYKHKIARIVERQTDLRDLLRELKTIFEDHNDLHDEIKKRTVGLSSLQKSLSDVQVFLFNEREENLRLVEENDRLRIEIIEKSRVFDNLVKQCGISKQQVSTAVHETTDTQTATSSNCEKESFRSRKSKAFIEHRESDRSCRSTDSNRKNNSEEDHSRKALLLEVCSLKTQLDNLRTVYKNEIDVLLKDREVVAEERAAETQTLEKEVDCLSSNLRKAQYALCETAKRLLELERENEEDKESFFLERKHLEMRLHEAQFLLACDNSNVNGAGGRHRERELKQLQNDLISQEKLSTQYQQRAKHYESEMKKWKEKASDLEMQIKLKTEKLTSELATLRNRNEMLDRRRMLEAAGFRADIKQLRDKLKDLERRLNKMKNENIQNDGIFPEEENLRLSSKQTLKRAKLLEKELSSLKLKVAEISKDDFNVI